jgi:4-hydroxy-tetrahydrodipicolinate synthase
MTQNGINVVLGAARKVQAEHPEIFAPLAEFFNIDIEARLNTPRVWSHLYYEKY